MDKKKEVQKKYAQKNREKINAYMIEWKRNKRLELLELIGNSKCIKCGFKDWRALQIDHIKGGGNKDRRDGKDFNRYLTLIKSNLKAYQVLCANCNWIKRYEEKECDWGKWKLKKTSFETKKLIRKKFIKNQRT